MGGPLLGVTRKSACEWHRAWLKGDKAALVSKGAARTLQRRRRNRLQAHQGAAGTAGGVPGRRQCDDQRWTSAHIAALIAERFHVRYTPRGVAYLMERLGWSSQVPAHRAARRDDEQIASWRRRVVPALKHLGGLGLLARLRRRVRPEPEAAHGQDLGPQGQDPGVAGGLPRPWAGLDRRTDLRQTRDADAADLPHPHLPPPQERAKRLHGGRLPDAAPGRAHPAGRPDLAGMGACPSISAPRCARGSPPGRTGCWSTGSRPTSRS